MISKRLLVAAWLLVAACASTPRRERPPLASLAGLNAAMWPDGPGVIRLSGGVGRTHADLHLEVAANFSTVTTACFDEPLVGPARVSLERPGVPPALRPVTRVDGLTVAGARLRSFEAALLDGTRCEVTLGAPQLEGLALVFDFPDRELHFVPSRPADQRRRDLTKIPGAVLVPVSRDPTRDWPLVAARVQQGSRWHAGAFLFSTATATPTLSAEARQGAGLEDTASLARRLAPPLATEAHARFPGLWAQSVELAPEVAVQDVPMSQAGAELPRGVSGVLGVRAWGAGVVTVDLPAGLIMIAPPASLDGGVGVAADELTSALRAASRDPEVAPPSEPVDP